jgi:predicted DNA-binding transcriptional regulator AlpA
MGAVASPAAVIPNRMLGVTDLAELLSLSEHTLRYLVKTGKVPAPIKIGKHLRWRPDQIRALIGESVEG